MINMRTISNFSEATAVLADFIPPTSHAPYTLDNIKALMEFLGNPQDKLSVIHVAGTSGKTSTSYYLAALLHATGHKVGLSISPHIDSVAERAQINMEALQEADYCRELSTFLDRVDESGIKVSYFEVLVAFMYWLFERKGVDYAVVEVGLGGLLDGTNVISSGNKVCVITDIGFDHVEILGKTLPEIANQKAGIILPHNQVFMNAQDPEVMDVIQKTCDQRSAKLSIVETSTTDIAGLPLFQKRNFELAYETVKNLLPSEQGRLRQHIPEVLETHIPARMEEVEWREKVLVLDGSHNEQKLKALVDAMSDKYKEIPITAVVSFGKNKTSSLTANLQVLRTLTDSIIATEFSAGQDEIRKPISAATIAHEAATEGFVDIAVQPDPVAALNQAVESGTGIVLVTGSFYLLNHIRPIVFADEI
jgi:dihydrofolate synthase/folylpolyglutamate synthase